MLLPRGVTGFESRNEGLPFTTDYPAFRGNCYAAAREVGWSVRDVSLPRWAYACNYALAVLECRESVVAVALNGVFPLLAFASPPRERQVDLGFHDCPELETTFVQFGYTVLPALELVRPLTKEMWQGLAPHEQKQLRYFRPRRIGDVICNNWD